MLNKVDDQLVGLNFNSRDVSFDKILVVGRLCEVQMLPSRLDNKRLDVNRRHPVHRTNTVGCTSE